MIYSFIGGADGVNPTQGVILDSAGNLYGTTLSGGALNLGTVYRIDASGQETVLHSFLGGSDGSLPAAGVIRDAAGNLYGTTSSGGPLGAGTVYEIDASGQERVLYSFTGGRDGADPLAGLIRDAAGNLYGTTAYGGPITTGTVFKIDVSGKETVLYSFAGGTDGAHPAAGVLRDAAGNLYGTTSDLGAGSSGTIYEVDATGHETVLYSFQGEPDGAYPVGGLAFDGLGNLFGATSSGGPGGGGTVFELMPLR